MKWYSIEKYRPIIGQEYVILTKNDNIYARVFDYSIKDGYFFHHKMAIDCDAKYFMDEITHFLILPPVEIGE